MPEQRDLVAKLIDGGMAPDNYELRLPWGGILLISADNQSDSGASYYPGEAAYEAGAPAACMTFQQPDEVS